MEQIKKAWNKIKRVNGIGSLLPLALLLVFFAVTTSTFWSTNNLMQILRRIRYHGYRHDFRCIDRRN